MGQSIEEMFMRDEYTKLAKFFQGTWQDPPGTEGYAYRVYLSQLCVNLNELFLIRASGQTTEEQKMRLARIRGATFVTPSGFLTQAKTLADHYKKYGRFPKILVVDLLLTTGESYSEMMSSMSKAITEELGDSDANLDKLWQCWVKLRDAIDYTSFMQSKDDPLLVGQMKKSMYKNQVSAEQYFGVWMDYEASIVFSDVVQHGDFLPTFWMSRDRYDQLSGRLRDEKRCSKWRREVWTLYNKSAVVWQKGLPSVYRGACAQQAIRCSVCSESGEFAITPFIFWHSVGDAGNEDIYAGFISAMKEAGIGEVGPLIEIMRSRRHYMDNMKLRLIMTISAILTFCHFVEDASDGKISDFTEFKSDVEKISEYFGKSETVTPAFKALLSAEASSLRNKLWMTLRIVFESRAEPLCRDNWRGSKNGKDFYLNVASNHLVAQNTNHRKQIMYRREHEIQFIPTTRFYEFGGFLEDYLADFPPDYTYLDGKLGALIMLLMWDIAELTVYRERHSEHGECSRIYVRDV